MTRLINPLTVAALALAPALGVGLLAPAHAAPTLRTAITDPAGDVTDDEDTAVTAPYADIVSADGRRIGDKLELRYTTAQALSPLHDPNWDSEDTHTDFTLDTDNDGKEDFTVAYGLADGALYAEVTKADDHDDPPVLCTGTATYTNNAHVATVPLSCLGNPARAGYQVDTSYDLDAQDDDSPTGSDAAPEAGFADIG
ncbi:hypothetical protein GCM10010124_34950 [Pilimelia terevasa]|uniref:Uncharacterized protein n=1 Tax=Pilimelia terevasa TaxID=53372 RepID=A0A8J3FL80_9ACTN|nr:hypothetical protein [Pilimelia terevasa]GGK39136.1 hypothetical protein GCM10010124_34950 [Pilimelia terevasa]